MKGVGCADVDKPCCCWQRLEVNSSVDIAMGYSLYNTSLYSPLHITLSLEGLIGRSVRLAYLGKGAGNQDVTIVHTLRRKSGQHWRPR